MAHRSSHVFRDSVMEILFEQDNEEKSVASLMLDALVKVGRSNFEVLLFVWQLWLTRSLKKKSIPKCQSTSACLLLDQIPKCCSFLSNNFIMFSLIY